MITNYDPALAVVDEEWLNRVGTAFAVAYYQKQFNDISAKRRREELNLGKILEILEASGEDNDAELEGSTETAFDLVLQRHEQQLKEVENRLVAVKSRDWVEAEASAMSWAELGDPPRITQEQFENEWQRTEAGY